MTAKYELTFFDEAGQIHNICLNDIGKRTITFGRSAAGVDIVMHRDCISRIHGRLFLTNDGVKYQDAHSTNGTAIVEGRMQQMRSAPYQKALPPPKPDNGVLQRHVHTVVLLQMRRRLER